MLQSALDLSKQWPQAVAKIAFGVISIVAILPNGVTEKLFVRLTEDGSALGTNSIAFLLLLGCVAYLFGSLIVLLGQIEITQKPPGYFVNLSTRVFETGNGLLIQELQETNKSTQLFGGVLGLVFFVGWIEISKLLFFGGLVEEFTAFGSDLKNGLAAPVFSIVLGVLVALFVCSKIFLIVRSNTAERYGAIEQEVSRLLSEGTE